MLATKLRALLQRDQGRDLFDLARALELLDGLEAAADLRNLISEWKKAYAERVIGSIRREFRQTSPYCPHYQEQH